MYVEFGSVVVTKHILMPKFPFKSAAMQGRWNIYVSHLLVYNLEHVLQMVPPYLFQFQNVFAAISECIRPKFKMYLSQFQNVFVLFSKCICFNCKVSSSK